MFTHFIIFGTYSCGLHLWRYFLIFLEVYVLLFNGVWAWSNSKLPLAQWICLCGDGPLLIFGFDYFIY